MNFLIYFLKGTIGKKMVIGLSGLGLCLFLLIHMLGNLLILSGPEAYNRYAHKLHEIPFFLLFELGLLAFFAGHILLSLLLAVQNKAARAVGDKSPSDTAKKLVQNNAAQAGSLPQHGNAKQVFLSGWNKIASWLGALRLKTMGGKQAGPLHALLWLQGALLLIFLGFHLWSFKFGPYYETFIDGQKARDIYHLVAKSFKSPFYITSYSIVLSVLCVHVLRGLPASCKSLGLSQIYMPLIEKFSWVFAFGVTLGFLAPIWYLFLFV